MVERGTRREAGGSGTTVKGKRMIQVGAVGTVLGEEDVHGERTQRRPSEEGVDRHVGTQADAEKDTGPQGAVPDDGGKGTVLGEIIGRRIGNSACKFDRVKGVGRIKFFIAVDQVGMGGV